jgi:magnesium transporter
MSYTALYRDSSGDLHTGLDEVAVAKALRDEEGLLWLNVREASDADERLLRETFRFHPLAIRDCMNSRYQRPKVDDFRDYLFVMLHGIDAAATGDLSSLVTLPAIEQLVDAVTEGSRLMERGAPVLAHAVADTLVESVLPTVDVMGDAADVVEDDALDCPEREVLQAILRLKRSALRIQRIMGPQREVMAKLARGDFRLVPIELGIYYRDIYDHVARIEDLTQTIRERADNALTTYLSAVGIRQNETMRVLSIVASVFLPLTLLAGIYGMNFENIPELGWEYGYFVILGVMLATTIGVIWSFWARSWIRAGRKTLSGALDFAVDPDHLREMASEVTRLRSAAVGVARRQQPRDPSGR